MKKVIGFILLFAAVPKALGQRSSSEHSITKKPAVCLSEELPILNIDYSTQRLAYYISLIKCPQPLKKTMDILYIVDGLPLTVEEYNKNPPSEIIETKVIAPEEQFFYCGPPRLIIAIKTTDSFYKPQLKKLNGNINQE